MDGEPNPLKEQMELLKYLREEAEANRVAQREEADANRKLLTDTFKIASPVLTVVILFAGFWGFHDLNTVKQTIRDTAQSEAQVGIKKMDKQVADTLAEEFRKENIQKTIQDAAQVATQQEAKPLIEAGVKSEVGHAVAAQSGAITEIATKAVNSKVQQTIAPLAARLDVSVAALHIQEVAARASADDAKAFDELLILRADAGGNQRQLIDAGIAERYRHARDQNTYTGQVDKCFEPESAVLKKRLFSQDLETRKQALEDCSGWINPGGRLPNQRLTLLELQMQVTPILVQVAVSDTSLFMRSHAIATLNDMFKSAPGFVPSGLDLLDLKDVKQWWHDSKADSKFLLLLADIRRRGENNLDRAHFFDELCALRQRAPERLRVDIQATYDLMVSSARTANRRSLEDVKKELGWNSCAAVQRDLEARLREWRTRPEIRFNDKSGVAELVYLKSCAPWSDHLSDIISAGLDADSLATRYAAIELVNTWEKVNLDPLSSDNLRGWWQKTKTR